MNSVLGYGLLTLLGGCSEHDCGDFIEDSLDTVIEQREKLDNFLYVKVEAPSLSDYAVFWLDRVENVMDLQTIPLFYQSNEQVVLTFDSYDLRERYAYSLATGRVVFVDRFHDDEIPIGNYYYMVRVSSEGCEASLLEKGFLHWSEDDFFVEPE